MEKRRKIIRPRDHIRKHGRGRNMTRGAIARHYVDMQGAGWVSSSPISEPPERPRVWLDSDDRRAKLMDMAREGQVVARTDLFRLLGARNGTMPTAELVALGIVAVPLDERCVRLVGTSPDAAKIGNRVHWARKRRRITRRELVRAYEGLGSNDPKPRVTRSRLEKAIGFFIDRFETDVCGLFDRDAI